MSLTIITFSTNHVGFSAMTKRRRPGFTIVELLVVIAVIGILVALLLPAVQSVREAARRTQCKNNLKQIGLALQNYHDSHSAFPFASTASYPAAARFSSDKHAWTEFILPFLEQQPLYQQVKFSEPVDTGTNRTLFENRRLSLFACPSSPYADSFQTRESKFFSDWGVTDLYPGEGPIQGLAYPLCAGSILPDLAPPDCTAGLNSFCISEGHDAAGQISWWHAQSARNPGLFNRGVTRTGFADALDGASNTLAAGERNAEECCLGGAFSWNAPVFFTGQKINSPTRDSDPSHYWRNCGSSSHHPGGGHFLFADGGVRFLSNSIDFRTYCFLGDKADGQVASVPNN